MFIAFRSQRFATGLTEQQGFVLIFRRTPPLGDPVDQTLHDRQPHGRAGEPSGRRRRSSKPPQHPTHWQRRGRGPPESSSRLRSVSSASRCTPQVPRVLGPPSRSSVLYSQNLLVKLDLLFWHWPPLQVPAPRYGSAETAVLSSQQTLQRRVCHVFEATQSCACLLLAHTHCCVCRQMTWPSQRPCKIKRERSGCVHHSGRALGGKLNNLDVTTKVERGLIPFIKPACYQPMQAGYP